MLTLLFGLGGYLLVIRRWLVSWGTNPAETRQPLPGDELVPSPSLETTRAITIQASPAKIWPWLVQVGYRRAGFYSYDYLERMAGVDITNTNRILPEFQTLRLGDEVHIAPETPLYVKVLDPERALVLHTIMNPFNAQIVNLDIPNPGAYLDWSWAFVLKEIDLNRTRLLIRVRGNYEPRVIIKAIIPFVLDPIHFLMERKMLLEIKHRTERMSQRNE